MDDPYRTRAKRLRDLTGIVLDPEDPADRAVIAVHADVTDRRGWRQAWDQFDRDVKTSIIEDWREVIRDALVVEDQPDG